jgi:hypothetical protein
VEESPELRAYDPDYPDVRAADAVTLRDPALRRLIQAAGITTVSYRPSRDLQRQTFAGALVSRDSD